MNHQFHPAFGLVVVVFGGTTSVLMAVLFPTSEVDSSKPRGEACVQPRVLQARVVPIFFKIPFLFYSVVTRARVPLDSFLRGHSDLTNTKQKQKAIQELKTKTKQKQKTIKKKQNKTKQKKTRKPTTTNKKKKRKRKNQTDKTNNKKHRGVVERVLG